VRGAVSGILSGSVSGILSGSVSSSLSGSVSSSLSGSVSCDFVSGSGSCDFVSGSGSCDFVSGSGSCDFVSDLSVETSRQDMGFQKRSFTATSNWGEYVTQVLAWFPCGCLVPGVVAGAGLANKRLEIKRLDKP
jgi:hypothetical protein